MALVTFQVLDGLEAGRVYSDLPTPVSLGREEDNDIQLNDDRVSRFHAKVQEDAGRIILTDLDSTNGTRVNGHPVRMRVLYPGDQVLIGRVMLLFGDPSEVAQRPQVVAEVEHTEDGTSLERPSSEVAPVAFPHGRPELPESLSPLQATQLSDILAYARTRIQRVLDEAYEQKPVQLKGGAPMIVPSDVWNGLQQLQMDLSIYLRDIADPGGH